MLLLHETQDGKPIATRTVRLSGDHISFGRSVESTYRLSQFETLSRTQATLRKIEGEWWLLDGSKTTPSGMGIRVEGDRARIDRQIQLYPGLRVVLFETTEYKAILECKAITEEPLGDDIEYDTVEVSIGHYQEQVMALRGSVDELREQMSQVVLKLAEIDDRETTKSQQLEDLLERLRVEISQAIAVDLGAKIDALAKEVKPQIVAVHQKNSRQDQILGRVAAVAATALLVSGVYSLSRGDSDTLGRTFDILQLLLGGGTGIMMIKDKSTNHKPEWQTH